MRTYYHEKLGRVIYPGMVSSSNAEFKHAVVHKPNGDWNLDPGVAFGHIVGYITTTEHFHGDAVALGCAPLAKSSGASGVLAMTSLSTDMYMAEIENESNVYPDGIPQTEYAPWGAVVNILVYGKIWALSERVSGQPLPMTPVKCFNGFVRDDLTGANNVTPFFFTGAPGLQIANGLWLQEILVT